MSNLLIENENEDNTSITKVSTFKYRDNFFKSPIKEVSSQISENYDLSPISNNNAIFLKKRKDALGTEIIKGGKDHKVTFCDQINETDLAKKYIFRQKTPDIKNIKFNFNKKDSKKIKNKKKITFEHFKSKYNNYDNNCNKEKNIFFSPKKNNKKNINNEKSRNRKEFTRCESCVIF